MPLQRTLQLGRSHAGRKSQWRHIERVQLEEVTMGSMALWRTWPAVALLAEIVRAAHAQASGLVALRQGVHGWRNIEQQPVRPRSRRRVRIVHHPREAARTGGFTAPFERGGNIRPLAGMQGGDSSAVRKCV